jgi:DNA polymerase III delta subunit
LQNQAAKFSLEKLTQFVRDVSEADIKSKSGQGELTQLLDLIFIKL